MADNINKNYEMKNKFLLITLFEEKRTYGNGIQVNESVGRKDIVAGVLRNAPVSAKLPEKAMVWFPLYAANEVRLTDGKFLVVQLDDIVMVEKIEEPAE